MLGNEAPGQGGIVGGPGGVRNPWSRDPEGEVEPAIGKKIYFISRFQNL